MCSVVTMDFFLCFQITKFEKLETDEERIKEGKEIYDQFIMKELLSQSHVSISVRPLKVRSAVGSAATSTSPLKASTKVLSNPKNRSTERGPWKPTSKKLQLETFWSKISEQLPPGRCPIMVMGKHHQNLIFSNPLWPPENFVPKQLAAQE